ncbi:hypothetical protein PENTCL1PPCAC_8473 [Pristionchus entomophagus]|uniref:Protein kinase domain-containing protein n=1 Tax=Pristionchus entomophagus TaxID=358040 RepID=A0AAV5ST27_9BILA|nr:hypothetical protein PENTCL1PPCAC_8473 [Pristionchus entomophagus]
MQISVCLQYDRITNSNSIVLICYLRDSRRDSKKKCLILRPLIIYRVVSRVFSELNPRQMLNQPSVDPHSNTVRTSHSVQNQNQPDSLIGLIGVVEKKLDIRIDYYKLMNGASLFFKYQNECMPEIYIGRYIGNVDLSAIGQGMFVAGEYDNVMYFYSITPLRYSQKELTFYSCKHDGPDSLIFHKVGKRLIQGDVNLAVQQPYFLNYDGCYIESFTGERIELQQRIDGTQIFFCRRDSIFIVIGEESCQVPSAVEMNNLVMVSLPVAVPPPHSIYVEDYPLTYMICGNQLLTIHENLEITVNDLVGLDTFMTKISGKSNGKLLINVHDNMPYRSHFHMMLSFKLNEADPISSTTVSEPWSQYQTVEPILATSTGTDPISIDYDSEPIISSSGQKQPPARVPELSGSSRQTDTIGTLIPTQNTNCPTTSNASHSTQPCDSVFQSEFRKKFKIIRILGQGGFGIVFEATNIFEGWNYAVKRISVQSSEENMRKALREVNALKRLDHQGIVRYNQSWIEEPPADWQMKVDKQYREKFPTMPLDCHSDQTKFIYIQMQLCNYSLREWLTENQLHTSRPIQRMKYWFKQMVSAVAYIHMKQIIHRDLKPENVLFFEEEGFEGVLKICDLGIATERKNDQSNTVFTRTSAGTKYYMSPEQSRGYEVYGSKTDVFTLGLILTEMCHVLTDRQRCRIFDNFRQGRQTDIIDDFPTTKFVALLTEVEQEKRPTSQQMLEHEYLS